MLKINSRFLFLTIFSLLILVIQPVSARQSLLENLTLEQRVAQMFMVTLHGPQLTEVGGAFLRQWQPGAVVLFTSNIGTPQAMTRLTNAYQQAITSADGIPLLISIDQEGGVVQRLTEGFTVLPSPILVTATGSAEVAQQVGQMVGEELAAVGINMNLAPVADLETNRENPIIFRRSPGSDPHLAGAAAANFALGLQSQRVLATLKHFPGHGETSVDSHAELPIVRLDRERLEAVEIAAFREGVNAGAAAVMVAHIWYPALEPEENLPASLSYNIITGILREELGFQGLILTDAMDMGAIDTQYSYTKAAIMAIKAGVDIVSPGPGIGLETQMQMIQGVIDAVHSGEISEARIDESVQRILDTKARFGILDWQPLDDTTASERVNAAGHEPVIENLFRASVTIAYDRYDFIPLTPDRRIAIIFLATRAQILHECGAYNPAIRWVGVADSPSDEQISWAVEAARWSDTAVVFTQNAYNNPRQQALVNALPQEKTIAVAIFSPYDWQTYPNVAGYVATYSPMRPGVPAACAVLFGAIPANGQLPVTLSPELAAGAHK